jgi:hypothetical protein
MLPPMKRQEVQRQGHPRVLPLVAAERTLCVFHDHGRWLQRDRGGVSG